MKQNDNNISVANSSIILEQSLPRSSSYDPGMLLITGQSRVKKRILAFLTVFLMTGVTSESFRIALTQFMIITIL